MNYFLITGASRGFGNAVARLLIENKKNKIIGICRNEPEIDPGQADRLLFFKYNLNEVKGIPEMVSTIMNQIDYDSINSIHLINNAATITPVGPLATCDPDLIIRHYHLNILAPVLITSSFMHSTRDLNCEKKILNITSGAAFKPYFGWSSYCSSKAALEMFTRCLALESGNSYTIQTYDPGMMDTAMQDEIRSKSPTEFIHVDKFISFKEEGKLSQPEFNAGQFVKIHFNKYT